MGTTDDIRYIQQTATDWCNLVTVVQIAEEFIDDFSARISSKLQHLFIASSDQIFRREEELFSVVVKL